MRIGFLFQPGAVWVGAHYSKWHRRLCINLVPFLTVWIMLPGGVPPGPPSV